MIRIIIEIDDNNEVKIINNPEKKSSRDPDVKKKSITLIVSENERICPKCNEPFKPNGNRQKYCSIKCGMKPKWEKKQPVEPIEKTLAEIEEHRKQMIDLSRK